MKTNLILISCLALLLVAVGEGSRAQTTTGVIVYAGADHNIRRIAADGTDKRRLTQDGMSDSPAWLPGGGQIAFASLRDGKTVSTPSGTVQLSQIYIMASDGSRPTRISDGTGDDRFPVATADGSRILFLRTHGWGLLKGAPSVVTEIAAMRLDGSGYRAYSVQTLKTGERIDRYPARISADGTKVVFIRQEAANAGGMIELLDVASSQAAPLSVDQDANTPPGSVEYLWPRFDPQGRIVVFRRASAPGSASASLISLDLTGKTVATLARGLMPEALANGFDVNWAGNTLIAARAPEQPGGLRPEEIYLYDLAAGRAAPPLTDGHAPAYIAAAGPPAPVGGATPTPGKPLIDTPDPLFYAAWERVDRPVREHIAARSWIWGPVGRAVAQEPYGDGTRLVQYFDKARMELNPAAGEAPAYVTNGLLVVEMLSGRVQVGPTRYETHGPAPFPIGGDADANPAPSYAVLAHIASLNGENKAAPALHTPVTTTLSSGGARGTITFPATERIGYFAPETGHNIPEVFYNFLNQTGKVYVGGGYHDARVLDWISAVGYPITEPYWTRMAIAGKVRNVMVQAYQRQILTYIPDYAPPWNVQFGNVGVQYYAWRYGRLP
ncbi:MAG: TolB family protein [Chloroflexia bacterium]